MQNKNSEQKIYVLDTNVMMSDPGCLDVFDNNIVIIPAVAIEELDDHKKDNGERGYNTRHVLGKLDALRSQGNLLEGIPTPHGGKIQVCMSGDGVRLPDVWKEKPDNDILKMTKYLADTEDLPVILVSNDTNVRIKADLLEIRTEAYKHEQVDEDYLTYNGREEILLSRADFAHFCDQTREIPVKRAKFPGGGESALRENEFLTITDRSNQARKRLGKVKNGAIVPLYFENSTPFDIIPRNIGQRFCMEALMTPAQELPLVILKGSAGTAKTFLTLACALEQTVNHRIYRKVTITRANVEFDKTIGALPGDEESKVGPLLRGCMDNLELLLDSPKGSAHGYDNKGSNDGGLQSKIDYLISAGCLSAEALEFMRGRSLTNQVLYVDEAQNTTVSQMKGILTRVGDGTKLVISGDLNQIDNPRLDRHNNGLAYALKLMAGDPMCGVVGFLDSETTRSPLAANVAAKISQA